MGWRVAGRRILSLLLAMSLFAVGLSVLPATALPARAAVAPPEAQVAPNSQVHLGSAIAEREVDHGAVFFKNSVTVNFPGGELSLSGDQGGAEHLYVDDV